MRALLSPRLPLRWYFEKPDQVADGVVAVLWVTKRKVRVQLVAVAASFAGPRQVARLLEIVDDRRCRSFGDAYGGGDVSQSCRRICGEALEDVSVVCHESPEMILFSCS